LERTDDLVNEIYRLTRWQMKLWIMVMAIVMAWAGEAWATPCPVYFAELHDKQGNMLSGVSVTVVKYGTLTAATIYSDRDCTNVKANPSLTDTRGELLFYARDGQYTAIPVKDGLDFEDIADIPIYGPMGDGTIPIGFYHQDGDDVCATGTGAIDQIGSTAVTLVIDKPIVCGFTKTQPSTLGLRFDGRGSITLSSGKTLTLNGRVINHTGRPALLGSGTYVLSDASGVRRYWFSASTLTADGTQCANPARATLNSGPAIHTIICTDNDASSIYGMRRMPDNWDGGPVMFTAAYVQTAADTAAMHSDITAQCRGVGEVVSSTWGTEVAIDDANVTGSSGVDQTTSAAVTPAGTCAAGDMLWFRWQLDAAGTTTAVATLHFLGFDLTYRVHPNMPATE
jgi:hypothetical protein